MAAKTLPGIKEVEYLPANETVLFPKQIPTPGALVSVIGNYTKLPTVELCSCTITDERIDAGLVYTTKVTGIVIECDEFTISQQYLLREKFHTYRITDVYDTQYHIGIDKKPYPEISFSPAIDGQPSGTRAISFEISWKSTLPPLQLVSL